MVVFSAFFNRCDFAQSINNISNNFSDLSGSIQTSQTENTLIESVKLQIESEISHDIIKKTGIKPESVSIQLNIKTYGYEKIVDFENAYISLPESTSSESVYVIKNYISGILGCEPQITGEIKK